MSPLGIFGGTFDPIHYGHLRTAFELLQALRLGEVRFVPAGQPPHRGAPLCDARRRLEMVQAAVADQPGFAVDDRELRRDGPSYTVTTLRELRADEPERSLCLIVGMDAFLGLPRWHEWREILALAHLVVAHRPGWSAPSDGLLAELLAERGAVDGRQLHDAPAGRIHVRAVTPLEISSTELRDLIVAGRDPRYLLPDAVRAIIVDTGCYHVPAKR
jgi:nicotinate-nucleotide adenylyltransferase